MNREGSIGLGRDRVMTTWMESVTGLCRTHWKEPMPTPEVVQEI